MELEFKFDDSGLKDMIKKLEDVGDATDGKHSFAEMFPPEFMRKYTHYPNIESFMDNCGFPHKTDKEFKAIPDASFNAYVRKSSRFRSWREMLDTATQELLDRNMKSAGL